jgi:hypothetical protein
MLLTMLATSCREESDKLLSYDHVETLAFGEAEKSFAGKFKVTWNGLNQYYALWDYEEEQGLDWDAVYDEYLPQFEALDERGEDDPVTDDELKAMLKKVLSPLHDGHFVMVWKNHVTGHNVAYSPSADRNASRDDAKISSSFAPDLSYYSIPANGEIELDNGAPIYMEYSTKWANLVKHFSTTPGIGIKWIEAEISRIETLTLPTEMDLFNYSKLKELSAKLDMVFMMPRAQQAIPAYDQLAIQYSFLEVPGFDVIDSSFAEIGITVKFALLKGNIAYFYFSGFSLTPYLTIEVSDSEPVTANLVKGVKNVWQSWFGAIQQLHKAGTLGGIIIDVRSNGGGMMNDGQFVAGALLPAGDFQYGYQRFKRGTGRYDYSPLMPAMMKTMDDEHEIIDDKPVVILINGGSVSMAEMTAQTVRLMPNGKLIGKRTHGGLCGLTDNTDHSLNYAGYIGVMDKTPVFGYVPSLASFTMNKEQLEGVGIAPQIEVALDVNELNPVTGTGRDTQLDRALQYIRTGN